MTHSAPSGPRSFQDASHLYRSPTYFGGGHIIREHLGLGEDEPIPLTIPHGVDCHLNHFDLGVGSFEPLYLALRPDIAERVARHKPVLQFPHPWLLLRPHQPTAEPAGTLFVSPPPSEAAFEQMEVAIRRGNFPVPWAVLLKNRGLERSDFEWWEGRGFATHTAGPMSDRRFYYKLRDIISRYAVVASPNMSSAVIFAAALGKLNVPLPGINLEVIDHKRVQREQNLSDSSGVVRTTWLNLFSTDRDVAQRQALDLLGGRYLAPSEELRERYRTAIAGLDRVVHLSPLRPGPIHALLQKVAMAGVPLHRLFPNPLRTIAKRLWRAVGLDRLAVIRGCDLIHYRVVPGNTPLEITIMPRNRLGRNVELGQALRGPKAATTEIRMASGSE